VRRARPAQHAPFRLCHFLPAPVCDTTIVRSVVGGGGGWGVYKRSESRWWKEEEEELVIPFAYGHGCYPPPTPEFSQKQAIP
jgi:hypothetical protein